MNDIGSDISSSWRLLTDDCTIYREVRNTVNAELLQQDLYKLYHWTQTWQLKLNLTKCKVMQITNKRNSVTFLTTLSLSGSTLSNSSVSNSLANYLGQLRHPKLKSKQHVCLIYWDRLCMDASQAKSLYCTSLTTPRSLWSPYGKVQCDSLERVQKRAARWD